MKTTKRSKMLISSIAMLLVALVALGSATYAWYTVNQEVTALGTTFKASTPTGLVISNDGTDGTWTNSINTGITTGTVLKPSSLSFNGTAGVATAVTTDAEAVTASARNTEATITDLLGNGVTDATRAQYYVTDTFYVKSQGSAQTVKAKVAMTGTPTDTFLNYAVIDMTAHAVLGIATSTNTQGNPVAIDASGNSATIGGSLVVPAARGTAPAFGGSDLDATGQSYAADTPHEILVVAYADGQNTKCFTTNASATTELTFDLYFYYT